MVAFTGRCLVHRAEIMQLHGAWGDALREARRAGGRPDPPMSQAAGQAFYRQAELHRLQGEFVRAEEAYRAASRCGTEPQPGLALLRLVQGNSEAAAATIRRVAAETTERLERVRLLPAYVEIMLAVGDADAARSACGELEQLARGFESGMLDAVVAHARGAVDLDAGDARAALVALRQRRRRLAGARGAVRGGAGAGARGPRVPCARGRGLGRARARRSPRRRSPSWGRRRTSPASTRSPAARRAPARTG